MQIAQSLVCTEVQPRHGQVSPHFLWIILNHILITQQDAICGAKKGLGYMLDLSTNIAKTTQSSIMNLGGRFDEEAIRHSMVFSRARGA